jgi:hypothetical protein
MSLKDDPTVERIREARHRISEEQGHDPQRVVNYYVELQKQYERRLLEKADEQQDEPVEA